MLNYSYCSDKYQYTMGKSFFETGRKDEMAVFNMFYRKAPENNNWAVCSGTHEVIECILNLGNAEPDFFERFLPGDEYAEFRKYLATMRFTGNVWALREPAGHHGRSPAHRGAGPRDPDPLHHEPPDGRSD